VINERTNKCTQREFADTPFHAVHIPNNSTFQGSAYVGNSAYPDASVLVNSWEYKAEDHAGNDIYWNGVWTQVDEGCVPISENIYINGPGNHTHMHARIYIYIYMHNYPHHTRHPGTIKMISNSWFDFVYGISNPNEVRCSVYICIYVCV
jgi:hypothetical protein